MDSTQRLLTKHVVASAVILASALTMSAQREAGTRGTTIVGAELAGKMHCGQCRLPKYEGRDQVPRLAEQREEYMVDAMVGYRDGKRSGADTTMTEVLYGVSDADIRALAHYLGRMD